MSLEHDFHAALAEIKRLNSKLDYYHKILLENDLLPAEETAVQKASRKTDKQLVIERRLRIYQSLFRGRADVYARRWTSGEKRGYAPATNPDGSYKLLTQDALYRHLSGQDTLGIYPLLPDGGCYFLALDFDKKNWKEDISAFRTALKQANIHAAMEISQSGEGCHVWLFFSESVPARLARLLGERLLKEAASIRGVHKLPSFDRMFPAQDQLTEKGLGNLIALPLQGERRKVGCTVFVDANFQVIADPWGYLESIKRYSREEVEGFLNHAEKVKEHEGDYGSPEVVLREGLLVPKSALTPTTLENLKSLCTMSNPEYFRAKHLRLSTDRIPSHIKGYQETPTTLVLPRGKADEIRELLPKTIPFVDQREYGEPIDADFLANLFPQQQQAVDHLKETNCGVLSATTGFGKTVVASALIAERKVNTLILVHRNQLIDQWRASLASFLSIDPKHIGQISGGKNKPTGIIDIATIQSIRNKALMHSYGHVIVDECHHISAFTFEDILRRFRSAYVHGLTATPVRKDGLHPLMFMQCGPIVFKVDAKDQSEIRQFHHLLHPRLTEFKTSEGAVDVTDQLMHNEKRNELIFNDILNALEHKRNPLVLTERVEHLHLLVEKLKPFTKNLIILTGALTKKQLNEQFQKLATIPAHEERIILATGKYAGEGFDNPRLDTLFLTMPITFNGTVAQYVGRLHRAYEGKESVEVYDYVDHKDEALLEKYNKRLKAYQSLGYLTVEEAKKEKKQLRFF
ncbi:DEAD/DEAH box helicase family protein [Chryseomicrobium palamuruense]|uniref:DEAD/DEAH box helicase family protein n=1 Tax=Chryseomicrobium palamuruense TaxID=682973 RepID=A0ABV8USK5_9BACL